MNSKLIFHDPSDQPLEVWAGELAAEMAEGEITGIRLTFQVGMDTYRRIDEDSLFNLKPEARNPMAGDDFDPGRDVEIEASLDSDVLALLNTWADSAEQAASYLGGLAETQPGNMLLATKSWYGLYIKQEMPLPPSLSEHGEVKAGYSTTWAHEQGGGGDRTTASDVRMMKVMEDYFNRAGVSFDRREDEQVLDMAYKGLNGEWLCSAFAREEEDRCGFYSILLIETPEDQNLAVSEFLTRANYNLPVGNFEFDMDNGEIRFKTSINLGGAGLSAELFDQLVTANVAVVDQYLPGLARVIDDEMSPDAAIQEIEK